MLRLKPEELDLLASITRRAYQSVLTHTPIHLRTGRDVGPLQTLRVASLAFRLPNPLTFAKEMPPVGSGVLNPERYKLVVFDDDSEVLTLEDILQTVDRFLEETRKQGCPPHFVLLNELSHAFERPTAVGARWLNLAEKYETYIVPGTYHATDELFGVAPIYAPHRKTQNVLKQNSARRQGEVIRTPDSRELFIYETDYGNVVVWICLDIYDPGLVLKFLSRTNRFSGSKEERRQKNREISLVLIPAYSHDEAENIRSCVKTLSRFSKTVMICTNAFVDPAGERLESYGFCGGDPLKEVLFKEYTSAAGKNVCKAFLYEVDLEVLRSKQAASYQSDGVFSSPFTTIINGGPGSLRDVSK